MKYIYYSLIVMILNSFQAVMAEGGILWDFKWEGNTQEAIRKWDITTDDIPNILIGAINFFMWIAGTVAIIFVIIGWYKILFGSLSQDKTQWKDTIIMALVWFVLAALSWFIVRAILDNFSGTIS